MKLRKLMIAASAALLLIGCSAPEPEPVEEPPVTEPETEPEEEAAIAVTNLVDFHLLEETADMSGYRWLNDSEPAFHEISLQESIRFFTEGGTGILVYSADSCPFCNRAIPVLNGVLKEYGLKAYYVDTDQMIASDRETSMRIYNELCSYIDYIFEKDEDGEPMFQIPEVIAVKDGTITDHHLSLVESFILTDSEVQMNEAETEELRNIYRKMIESIAD
ncbi:MAG: hypothetical protein IJ225_02630 [Solobacterium sp.]|nr:hypothetical protein [Solobacterium sp.]